MMLTDIDRIYKVIDRMPGSGVFDWSGETIGNLVQGKYNPSLVLAWNIAKVFDVSIEEIFTAER